MIGGARDAASMAAAAAWIGSGSVNRPPPDPKDVKIKELTEQVRSLTDKANRAESIAQSKTAALEQANLVVDSQATQIVDLQAKAALGAPVTDDRMAEVGRLQRAEDKLRGNLERAEVRASQLVSAWPKGFTIPPEPAYFKRNDPPPDCV